MNERPELKNLVVTTLKVMPDGLTARNLYDQVRYRSPTIFRHEDVNGFRGFVKILQTFEEINCTEAHQRVYFLKHKRNI